MPGFSCSRTGPNLIVSPPHILRLFRIHRDGHQWYSGAISFILMFFWLLNAEV